MSSCPPGIKAGLLHILNTSLYLGSPEKAKEVGQLAATSRLLNKLPAIINVSWLCLPAMADSCVGLIVQENPTFSHVIAAVNYSLYMQQRHFCIAVRKQHSVGKVVSFLIPQSLHLSFQLLSYGSISQFHDDSLLVRVWIS